MGNQAGTRARITAEGLRAAAARSSDPERRRRLELVAHAYERGSDGEVRLGDLLERLRPEGWFLYHDLPIGDRGANLDHLVVGPGGIFTINTKNLSGSVWVSPRAFLVDGWPSDCVAKARAEAQYVAERLDAPVIPVIAVFCPKMNIKRMPDDVEVVWGVSTVPWLRSHARLLSPRRVEAVASKIDDPATWGVVRHNSRRR